MNYLNFYRELKNFPAISLREISKLPFKVYNHRLADWQKKGYLERVANGIYIFGDAEIDEKYLWYLSNKIYEPSYISLEAAFAYYGFIPESVYQITAVSTKKTYATKFRGVSFFYRTISRKYYFGYRHINWEKTFIRIAEPEKALIDYFYLNSEINSVGHIEELRFNSSSIREKINFDKMAAYLNYYSNKSLSERISIFRKWLDTND
ncbi:MAG: hypothetical protein L6Q59_15735 [Ignavibacteriaceae bacterium]|nr:hypothetical protein [Ignavibacteriaceae bacterium]